MMLMWTKTHTPLSWIIRKVTGSDCSHFSIVFESNNRALVFESNLLGTHPKFLTTMLDHSDVIHWKRFDLPIEVEDVIWNMIVEKYDGKSYDLLGAVYLGVSILKNRLFKTPLPKLNKWEKNSKYFCNEIYEVLQATGIFPVIEGLSMHTPHDIWNILKDWKEPEDA